MTTSRAGHPGHQERAHHLPWRHRDRFLPLPRHSGFRCRHPRRRPAGPPCRRMRHQPRLVLPPEAHCARRRRRSSWTSTPRWSRRPTTKQRTLLPLWIPLWGWSRHRPPCSSQCVRCGACRLPNRECPRVHHRRHRFLRCPTCHPRRRRPARLAIRYQPIRRGIACPRSTTPSMRR